MGIKTISGITPSTTRKGRDLAKLFRSERKRRHGVSKSLVSMSRINLVEIIGFNVEIIFDMHNVGGWVGDIIRRK